MAAATPEALAAAFSGALNDGDADALGALFTDDALFVNIAGMRMPARPGKFPMMVSCVPNAGAIDASTNIPPTLTSRAFAWNPVPSATSQEIGRLMTTLGWRRFSSTLLAYTKAGPRSRADRDPRSGAAPGRSRTLQDRGVA